MYRGQLGTVSSSLIPSLLFPFSFYQNPSQPGVKTCVCNTGYSDTSCNVPVINLANGQPQTFDFPGKSWRYYQLSIPYTGNANLLVQMTKPPVSYNTYQPVLVLGERSSPGASTLAPYGLPGYSSINPSGFVLQVRESDIPRIFLEYSRSTSTPIQRGASWLMHAIRIYIPSFPPAELSLNHLCTAGQLHVQHLQLLHPLPSPRPGIPICVPQRILGLLLLVDRSVQQRALRRALLNFHQLPDHFVSILF